MSNSGLFFLIHSLSRHNLILDQIMVFSAQSLIFIAFILVIISAVSGSKERKALLLSILSAAISLLLTRFIRIFIQEPRPFVTYNIGPLINQIPDLSFPSFHTTLMSVIAFSFLFAKSRFTPVFFILLILVGFSRIYVGVHYPLDILGAVVIALLSTHLTLILKNLLSKHLLNLSLIRGRLMRLPIDKRK